MADQPKSYDYARRKGSRELSWQDFESLSAKLAETLAGRKIDTIIGVAKAGLFPATLVACALRCELYPARLSRRLQDELVYDSPVWHVPITNLVKGKSVAVIDEIVDTGETLAMVADQARELGAERVVTAAMIAHSWASPAPDVTALVSDELVIFPWDSKVLIDGEWQPHPEIANALALQEDD